MHGILHRILEIILSVDFLMGVLGNGFIIVVNCMEWVKRRKISSVDGILSALAISRSAQLLTLLINTLICVLHPEVLMSRKMVRIMTTTWTVTNHFSTWFAASLSIFYFLKIANFSNFLFLYLKWRAKKVISVTLWVSLVLLVLNIVFMNTHADFGGYKGNLSYSSSLSNSAQFFIPLLFTITLFTFIPFTVSLMTFLLLIFSLWKHLKRMQHNARGSRDASTTAHVKALQTVIAFLLLYAIFFLLLLVQVWNYMLFDRYLIILFVWSLGIAFPSGHSFVLILGNGKLRQVLLLVLWWLRCRSKDVDLSIPRTF